MMMSSVGQSYLPTYGRSIHFPFIYIDMLCTNVYMTTTMDTNPLFQYYAMSPFLSKRFTSDSSKEIKIFPEEDFLMTNEFHNMAPQIYVK